MTGPGVFDLRLPSGIPSGSVRGNQDGSFRDRCAPTAMDHSGMGERGWQLWPVISLGSVNGDDNCGPGSLRDRWAATAMVGF